MTEVSNGGASRASRLRFNRNIRWQFVANGSQALFGGLYLVTLGRFLGPTNFGVFSAVTAAVAVVGLFLELRLQEVVARDFCHIDAPELSPAPPSAEIIDLLALELLTRLVPMVFALSLTSWTAARAGLPPSSQGLLFIAALGFVASKTGSMVSAGLLRVLGRTNVIARYMALDWGLRLMLTLLVGVAGRLDVKIALWVALAAGGSVNFLQVKAALHEYSLRLGPLPWSAWRPRDAARRLLPKSRLVLSNLGISCSDLMAKDLDVVLLSGMLGSAKVGLYKMAKSFIQLLWRAIDPFYITIMPEVQRLWQRQETAAVYRLLWRTSFGLFAYAVILVGLSYIAMLMFGTRILGQSYAEVPKLMLAMSTWILVCAPLVWGVPLAVAVNRPELSVAGSLAGLVVGLTSFVTLTPHLGLLGGALSWNATLITSFVFTAGLAVFSATRAVALRNPRK